MGGYISGDISQNCNGNSFFAFTGHMMDNDVGRGFMAARNLSITEQVMLKFWIYSSSAKSQTVASQKLHIRGV